MSSHFKTLEKFCGIYQIWGLNYFQLHSKSNTKAILKNCNGLTQPDEVNTKADGLQWN